MNTHVSQSHLLCHFSSNVMLLYVHSDYSVLCIHFFFLFLSIVVRVWAYSCVPSEVCSQLWVGVSQTAKRPAGKFPISPWCSVQCRLTSEGSEIHNTASSLSLSLLASSAILSLSISLALSSLPSLSPQMNQSRDEKLSGMLADRQCFTVI